MPRSFSSKPTSTAYRVRNYLENNLGYVKPRVRYANSGHDLFEISARLVCTVVSAYLPFPR